MDYKSEMFQSILLFIAFAIVYFIPAIIGRKKDNASALLALNFFLGWTFIGWVAALVWALTKDKD